MHYIKLFLCYCRFIFQNNTSAQNLSRAVIARVFPSLSDPSVICCRAAERADHHAELNVQRKQDYCQTQDEEDLRWLETLL